MPLLARTAGNCPVRLPNRETIQKNQADVIELEACLRQQCYKLYQEQDWNSLLRTVQFQHEFTILP